MPACCLGINTELKNYDFFFGQLRFFQIFPHSSTVLPCWAAAATEEPTWMFRAAQSKEEAAFKALKRGLWYINSPFQVQKHLLFPFSITIIPIGFLRLQLLPSRQTQNAAPRAMAVLSPLPLAGTCHHDDLSPAQERNSHRPQKSATVGHSMVSAQGGGRAACVGLMGPSRWPPLYPQHNLSYCSIAMKN